MRAPARSKSSSSCSRNIRPPHRWRRPPTSSAISAMPRTSGPRPAVPTRSRWRAAPVPRCARSRAPLCYTWEAERDWPKAIDAFQSVARDLGPRDFLFDDVQFSLARVQELGGKPADAIATYERLLKDAPNGVRAEEAKQQLMRLGGTVKK